jgi:hypothetical protein
MRNLGTCAIFTLAMALAAQGFSSTTVSPTTTLSAETGNNSSAADSFQGSSNGNASAGNVSKVDTRTLLYSGAKTKIYAHYMPWFGVAYHMNVGYSTNDPNQSARTVNDMISRGIQGVMIDWYGPNAAHEDASTESMLRAAEQHPGFGFAIMVDAGGIKGNPTSGVINALNYAWQKYEQSGNYMRIQGRPVVFYFGVESMGVDWNSVRANISGNPIFIFENNNGFSAGYSDGAFAWANGFNGDHSGGNWGQPYLNGYYATARGSEKVTFGGTWKGFNDGMAGWGQNRVLGQNCGQTWLNTFAEIGRHYSSGSQLANLQLVTWNDYEEGTAIEMGIENCVAIGGSASGNKLSWRTKGSENTVHHYTVYISTDGENLMPVTEVPSGQHSLDLGQFGFSKGAYTVYVKAVGQPSMKNHMSGPIGFTADGGGGSTPLASGTDISLAATPNSLVVAEGASAATQVTVTPKGNFKDSVTLSCGTNAPGLNCSFDKSTLTPGSKSVTATLTVTANSASAAVHHLGIGGQFAFWFPGIGLGMVLLGDKKRSRRLLIVMLLLSLAILVLATSCGGTGKTASSGIGTSSSTAASSPGTYQVTIAAQSGSLQRTTTATITVK